MTTRAPKPDSRTNARTLIGAAARDIADRDGTSRPATPKAATRTRVIPKAATPRAATRRTTTPRVAPKEAASTSAATARATNRSMSPQAAAARSAPRLEAAEVAQIPVVPTAGSPTVQEQPTGWQTQDPGVAVSQGGQSQPYTPPVVAAPRSVPPALFIIWGGAALVVLGSFLPWIKVTAPFLGTMTKNGTEGDGVITLVLGLVVAGLATLLLRNPPMVTIKWGLIGITAIIGAIVVYDAVDAAQRFADIQAKSDMFATSLGIGLYVAGLGAVGVLVGVFTLRSPWLRGQSSGTATAANDAGEGGGAA